VSLVGVSERGNERETKARGKEGKEDKKRK
jgi:hypothetical protein